MSEEPAEPNPDAAPAKPQKAAAKSARQPETVEWVMVTGPAAGRRRAGFTFGADLQEIRRDALTDEALGAIMTDPVLAVAFETRDAEAET